LINTNIINSNSNISEKIIVKVFNFKNGANCYFVSPYSSYEEDKVKSVILISPSFFTKDLYKYIKDEKYKLEAIMYVNGSLKYNSTNLLKKVYGNIPIYGPNKLYNDSRLLNYINIANLKIFFYSHFFSQIGVVPIIIDNYLFCGRLFAKNNRTNENATIAKASVSYFKANYQNLFVLPSIGRPFYL
jgi:hypothetical protein